MKTATQTTDELIAGNVVVKVRIVDMREKALREAARVAGNGDAKRPCACDTCTCGNYDDARDVAYWDAREHARLAILALVGDGNA